MGSAWRRIAAARTASALPAAMGISAASAYSSSTQSPKPSAMARLPVTSRFLSEMSIETTLAPRDARMTAFKPLPHPRSTIVFPRISPNKWSAYSKGKTASSLRCPHLRTFHSGMLRESSDDRCVTLLKRIRSRSSRRNSPVVSGCAANCFDNSATP